MLIVNVINGNSLNKITKSLGGCVFTNVFHSWPVRRDAMIADNDDCRV